MALRRACSASGPVPAVQLALQRANWTRSDVERIEINEAFAAITLACLRELELPEDIVNVKGDSIAHGHAIGATGAVLTTRLLHSMRRDGLKRGIVTLCIGGGQGIALALEAASYSPELNPNEMANADLKHAVIKLAPARTKLQLVKATAQHLRTVQRQPERIKSYFEHRPVRYAA
jgi:hypothetical protein